MPTVKPRVTVTLSESVYQTITRMSELTGESRPSIIAGLLDSVHPPLMRTVALIEAAVDAPQKVRDGLKDTVESMEKELLAVSESSVGQVDMLIGQFSGSAAKKPTAPKKKARSKRSNPRPSNTGVRSSKSRDKGK